MKNYLFILVVLCMGLSLNINAQNVRYVKENGQNWDPWSAYDWYNAYSDLQAVIDISYPGDIICVAKGTYVPTYAADNTNYYDPYNRNNAFVLKNGVQIYGGFEGTEDFWSYNLTQRDFVTNETILSGYLPSGQNAYHVVVMVPQSGEDMVLDGFTITGGYADWSSDICVDNYCGIGRYNGGGVYVMGSGAVTLAYNQIYNNYANGDGGGVYIEMDGLDSMRLIKNSIHANYANNQGGGVRAVFYDGSSGKNIFSRNIVKDNITGNNGGGISMYMENYHEFSFVNNLINNNYSGVGGGIYMEGYPYSPINMINNTVVNNIANTGGGIFTNFYSYPTMTVSNTIFWGNFAHSRGNSIESTYSSSVRMENCLLEEGYMPGAAYSSNNMNIFNQDPQFVDAPSGDFHLQSTSPAINAGDNSFLTSDIIHDLYGQMRILDNVVDMGVAEFVNEIEISPLIDTIIYVSELATGTNTGENWTNAFVEFADALVAAQTINDATPGKIRQIRVAKGTYSPKYVVDGGSTYKDRSFVLPVNVKVYGGFAGTEGINYNLKQRDFLTNTSVLNGYCSSPYPENVYHVVVAYIDNATDTVLLDGFTITGGEAMLSSNFRMSNSIDFSNLTSEKESILNKSRGFNSGRYPENVRNVVSLEKAIDTVLVGNLIDTALLARTTTLTEINAQTSNISLMSNNLYYENFYAEYGAGLYAILNGGTIIVTNNIITNNNSRYGAGGLQIDGAYSSKIIVANNTITNNSGGADIWGFTNCDILINNNIITDNSAYSGSGLFAGGRYSTTINIVNNLITNNHATLQGGGVYIETSEATTTNITNNTIVNNTASYQGGGIYIGSGDVSLNNSIIYGNSRNGTIDNIYIFTNIVNYAFGTCYVNYCLLNNGTFSTGVINNGNNILGQNPLFANSFVNDFRLSTNSPAINKGNNTYIPLYISKDLDGKSRILEEIVDMGAFESGEDIPVVDPLDYDTILYVNYLAGGTNTGENWVNAYNDFADALRQAEILNYTNPGTIKQIWVAQGQYMPSLNSSYRMVSDVSIYGGFLGNETDCEARDYVQNQTILKGNGKSVIYNNFTSTDNLVNARLDGFTITGGAASLGGGIYNMYAPCTIANCIIEKCTTTTAGGGLYNNYSEVFVYNTIIQNNQGRVDGGGVANINSNSYFLEVIIRNNTVLQNTGGGVYNECYPTLERCIISGNKANGRGGGIFNNGRGGTLINVLVTGNYAGLTGGGIFNYNATTYATNVTISGNSSAGTSGGVRNDHSRNEFSSHFYAKNCIIWGNKVGNTTVDNICNISNCFSYIANCLVENSNGSGSSWNSSLGYDQGGNIGGSPDFIDYQRVNSTVPTTAGNFHLENYSSCIDAGDNAYIPSNITTDLDGKHRIINNTVDMGAYESGESTIITYSDTILYVKIDASGTNTGENWDNAYINLSNALDQVVKINNLTPDRIKEIWVARGTYMPDSIAGNGTQIRDKAFVLPPNVKVYGGFAGTELATYDLSLRDFITDNTVLSGKLNVTTDVYHVVIGVANAGEKILLDGFTITSGNADGTISDVINVNGTLVHGDYGGGIYIAGSGQVTLSNNIVTNNSGYEGAIYTDIYEDGNIVLNNNTISLNTIMDYGGGISIYTEENSTVTLDTNTIISNSADFYGGGIYINGSGTVNLNGNTITDNSAGNGDGGGIYASTDGIVALNDNIITDNSVAMSGGGIYSEVLSSSGEIILNNNTIEENHARLGGGVYGYAESGSNIVMMGNNIIQNTSISHGSGIYMDIRNAFTSSTISHNLILNNSSTTGHGPGVYVYLFSQGKANLTNNLIANNSTSILTSTTGGGIYVYARSSGEAMLVNNTVANNIAQQGAGLYADIYDGSSRLEVLNTIFWDNEILKKSNANSDNLAMIIDHCLVQQSIPSNIVNLGNNVLSQTFPFANLSPTNYRLGGTNSPAYNNGSNVFANATGITTDLDGELRILSGTVDIGAYEYRSSSNRLQKSNSNLEDDEDPAIVEDVQRDLLEQEKQFIAVYPNPTSYTLHIQSLDGIESLTIYDINGKMIKRQINNSDFIDVSNLAEGTYVLKIKTTKTETTKRFIKR